MLFSKDAVEFEDLINDSEIKLYNKIASVN